MVVRHRCDNPPCIAIDHLELGTQAENVRDMHSRGRAPAFVRQVEKPNARLTVEQVREIRVRKANGESLTAMGREYGVSVATLSLIVNRKTWADVA